MSHQDDAFVIDPVTNFPREQALLSYLDEVKGKKSTALAIGFSFNSIAAVSYTHLTAEGARAAVAIMDTISQETDNEAQAIKQVTVGIDQISSVVPVSYTHLDVYKRQAFSLATVSFTSRPTIIEASSISSTSETLTVSMYLPRRIMVQ